MDSCAIIICTYNPEPQILKRLLTAISLFETPERNSEIIIVDNNSSPAIAQYIFVQQFLEKKQNARIIIERKPGLTSTRITGIKQATAEWVIFFDDDNEPYSKYLSALNDLITAHPSVFCWGAGTIRVEYVSESTSEWLQKVKPYFQERSLTTIHTSCEPAWTTAFPNGTGLAVRKEILADYITQVENGAYTLSDRKGRSLSSGGDVQIVFTAIKEKHQVASAPGLFITHLIRSEKTSINYLCRLSYGTASSYLLAYNQVFIDKPYKINKSSNLKILKLIYYLIRTSAGPFRINFFLLAVGNKLGEINGNYVADPSLKKPILLSFFETLIRY